MVKNLMDNIFFLHQQNNNSNWHLSIHLFGFVIHDVFSI